MVSFAQESQQNFEKAKVEAKKDSKYILMSFSGSDWCSSCKKLHKELFENEEFKKWATDNVVQVNLDFPMKKGNKLSKEQTTYNDSMAEKYNKKGVFPLVLVFDSEGNLIGKLDSSLRSLEERMNNLKSLTSK